MTRSAGPRLTKAPDVPRQRPPLAPAGADAPRDGDAPALEAALDVARAHLGIVVDHAQLLVVGIGADGVITTARGPGLGQHDGTGVLGNPVDTLPPAAAALVAGWRDALGGAPVTVRRETAGRTWEVVHAPLPDAAGDVPSVLVVARDVTDGRRLEEHLESVGRVDPLTGLLSRAGLQADLDAVLAEALAAGHRVALLYADIDEFRDVNDSLGHFVGDELLGALAARVVDALPGAALLGRHGGDEFLAVLAGPHLDDAAVDDAAASLLAHLSRPLTVVDADLDLTASIGVSLFPDDAPGGTELLAHADAAMYRAKRSGGAGIIRYSSAADDTRRRLALTTKLRRAIADETIEVHYQPIVDLATGELRKVEALARWQDPEEGPVPPGVFIPIAEASRLIIALGEVVISKVVRQLVAWDAEGLVVPCAAVNVSAAHLRHDRLLATIDAAVEKSGLDPRRLEVEFTESAVMDDFRRAAALIADLRARGIGVAIDDFGTGHSSLARLRDLPVDTVKLDRSFIAPLPEPAARALVDAFLGLARGLSLRTVAEGVETTEQHEQLVTAGCDAAQGYLFARPMPAAQLPGWLVEHHARVPAVKATRTARASGTRSGRPRPARRGM